MEVKKYRYNDMTERYRRMNRFYIIATVVLGGSFIVYMWLKMVMSSISAMTVYGNTVVMAAFTIANTVIYMRNRATKQLKIIATYEVGIEFLLVGVQSDAHFISFAIIAIFLLQIPYFDKKGLTKTAVGMAVLYAIVTAVQIKKGVFVMNVSGFCEIILTVFIGIAILNVGKIIIAFNDDAMGATKDFSYDYIKYSEPTLRLDAKDEEGFQDVNLMLFHKVIAFDNYRQKLILILNIKTDDLEINYHRAERELNNMKELLLNGEKAEHIPCKLRTDFQPLFNEAAYCSMVEKAKHYIREGDIFQVVLSNRLEAEMEGSLLDAYRVLRTTNPSPYMFYFSGSDGEIVGASPETLVKLEDGVLHTFPLAGTRPRGATEEADKALEAELLADEKERSEHNMLVDLGRNDIGKISRIGTVEVEKYMSIERYSHVMHIGSTVRGVIREDADALDAVDAILPAGTLSGAPKLRACEIINELEDNKRGIYGGAIGYISFTGNLDTCIAIRLAFSKNGKVFVRSGAGIVADSVPEKEYRECIQKAAAVRQALQKAQEGMEA